jgi:hypothetical protein
MAMCLWFPWLQRIQPHHGAGMSFSRRSRDNGIHKAIASEPEEIDIVIKEPGNLRKAAEKISHDFDVSEDDIQRMTNGFVAQLGPSTVTVYVKNIVADCDQRKGCADMALQLSKSLRLLLKFLQVERRWVPNPRTQT